ncbi:hypothetical protein Tco_0510448 [Tanacetum coccineum]
MCVRMFPKESDKIERYVGGLPDMIHGSVVSSKPTIMQEAIEMATEMMDMENPHLSDHKSQKQGVAIAYTAGPGERKEYAGTLPKPTCYECEDQGLLRSDLPGVKETKTHGNQVERYLGHVEWCMP